MRELNSISMSIQFLFLVPFWLPGLFILNNSIKKYLGHFYFVAAVYLVSAVCGFCFCNAVCNSQFKSNPVFMGTSFLSMFSALMLGNSIDSSEWGVIIKSCLLSILYSVILCSLAEKIGSDNRLVLCAILGVGAALLNTAVGHIIYVWIEENIVSQKEDLRKRERDLYEQEKQNEIKLMSRKIREEQCRDAIAKFSAAHDSKKDWMDVPIQELTMATCEFENSDFYEQFRESSIKKIMASMFEHGEYQKLINFIGKLYLSENREGYVSAQILLFKSYVKIGLSKHALRVYGLWDNYKFSIEHRYECARYAEDAGQTAVAFKIYDSMLAENIVFKDIDLRYRALENKAKGETHQPPLTRHENNPKATALSVSSPINSDVLLEKYSLINEIGRGAMGVIYKAQDLRLGRFVAIKKLKEEIRINRADKERFLKEARIVAGLKHPNIVDIYDIVETGGDIYLVFEFLEGKPLDAVIAGRPKPYSWEDAESIIRQVHSALTHAHSRHVIHRDLKPANIMLLNDGMVKVMDFGIAREVKNTVLRHSGRQDSSGTLMYMAPEQHLGDGDARVDVYSLGVTIYELVTGQVPFKGADLYESKKHMTFRPPSELNKLLSKEVDRVIQKCLEFDPQKRQFDI